jgi:hypothetical protein
MSLHPWFMLKPLIAERFLLRLELTCIGSVRAKKKQDKVFPYTVSF